MALSIVTLLFAIYTYAILELPIEAGFFAIIGIFGLALACVIFYQNKQRLAAMKIEAPKMMTTIECKNCGNRTTKEFQRGDFVFKELDTCPKCPEQKQMITGIYKEIKEKEKVYAV
jgi:transcription elongation factor Elf1